MVDFTKKVLKHATETLEPGEQVLHSGVITPRGAVSRQAVAGGVGGLIGVGIAAAMNKRAGEKASEGAPQGSWADQFPKQKVYLSVTDRRLVVHAFGEGLGRPKELLGWIPREAVSGVQGSKGRIAHPCTLHFSDGSTYDIDVMKGGKPEVFAQLLGGHFG